ncbi:Methyltransferase type 11 [Pseudonocardia dioxanivorans CB1190]|uniref:Methyltransferase type 11 n=1 Tax=Pseudonocardia dioxanivorans (strain ATCC 55486 / DSM 44775 / JCM 13855 / CB1190) TaxID=675635 RepID=F4CXD9_PSEUX|nr:class I SAM-dependent methyltransferase [Pseudonocardia dioxanivorans]AEA26513.1 Methyltransferase type 11 [Pseudonocardia dioxanivorans CB1190]
MGDDGGVESTDRARRFFSRFYASMSARMDDEGMGELRAELLGPLSGAVVEIGAGNGRNFARYPAAVEAVTAVEPEPRLRRLATDAAVTSAVTVTVVPGVAERLPLPDGCADAVVLCLVMCSLPDRAAALAEVRRVLRPGGVARFLQHTIAETPGLRAVQRLADATVWPLLTGGCHTATDPVDLLREAGFAIEECRRLRFPDARFTQPSTPHVLGTARAPA